jgi:conjugative transposon TraN protein
MKKISMIVFIAVLLHHVSVAQSPGKELPEATTLVPFKLCIGYNITTVLIFPLPVFKCDRGSGDILIHKVAGLENVLHVKAGVPGFTATNLHVFTSDGKVYPFQVAFMSNPGRTTFDLQKLQDTLTPEAAVQLTIPGEWSLGQLLPVVEQSKPFFEKKSTALDMQLRLESIHHSQDLMLFRFQIVNHSNLPYDTDFTKFFIADKRRAKRSSVQQTELTTFYNDIPATVSGHSHNSFTVAVPRFTIAGKKVCRLQVFEKNGGRHVSLNIKNRHLLKAKRI